MGERLYILYVRHEKSLPGLLSEDGKLTFMPDKNMTRAEFACMISNYLNINVYNYRGTELPYDDADKIPQWAYMQVQGKDVLPWEL